MLKLPIFALPEVGTVVTGPGPFKFETSQGRSNCVGRIVIDEEGVHRLGHSNHGIVAFLRFADAKNLHTLKEHYLDSVKIIRHCASGKAVVVALDGNTQ